MMLKYNVESEINIELRRRNDVLKNRENCDEKITGLEESDVGD